MIQLIYILLLIAILYLIMRRRQVSGFTNGSSELLAGDSLPTKFPFGSLAMKSPDGKVMALLVSAGSSAGALGIWEDNRGVYYSSPNKLTLREYSVSGPHGSKLWYQSFSDPELILTTSGQLKIIQKFTKDVNHPAADATKDLQVLYTPPRGTTGPFKLTLGNDAVLKLTGRDGQTLWSSSKT
jgi:hypothetical protein